MPAFVEGIEARAAGRWGSVLRIPLHVKLIVADSALVSGALVAGAWLVRHAPSADGAVEPLVAAAGLVAVALTIAINALIVCLALRPLHLLERAAADVASGHPDARATVSAFADRRLTRVIETFNAALDAADASRHRLRAVAARSLNTAEAERRRVAIELHEGVAQTLAATRLRLRLARRPHDSELQAEELETLSGEVGQAIEMLREIALALRPLALDVLGLGPAVEALVESVAPAARLRTDVRCETQNLHLDDEAELALYRILEEALANVVQHASARTVSVRLRASGDGVAQLIVEDDGQGFAAEERLTALDAIGLAGMQERAAYVGGRVEILSAPGRGTRVTADVPVAEPVTQADGIRLTA